MHLWGLISGVLLLAVLACAIAGTVGPQYHTNILNCDNEFYLYQTRTKCDGSEATTKHFNRDDFPCKESYDKITSAYAFAIAACITAGVATIVAFTATFVKSISTRTVLPLIAATSIFLVISWPLSESVRSVKQCDATSLKEGGYDISWGLALLISSWCLSFVVLVLAGLCHVRPLGGKGSDAADNEKRPLFA